MSARAAQAGALASLLALVALGLAWEIWLAPLRPGGSWLSLKVLPLLAPLFGLLRRRRSTFQWTPFIALAYFAEGVVRAWSEPGPVRTLAVVQVALSLTLFACTVLGARALARPA
jgi:uncharacterized membrane protein